ncbi:MAG: undecaprenyl-phosphate glucose phosphotransferase [Mesonia hippocampi]|uniref:undecaprenyl-phosphate glucose phosphotransferase n=1 Tax=Mesonia hippocampi TaxID=1628250 RepID=UPI003F9DD6C4
MPKRPGRYSIYLKPISYLIDLGIFFVMAALFKLPIENYIGFCVYIAIGWMILSIKSGYYEIYRYTQVVKIISLTLLQALIFCLIVFSFFGIFEELNRSAKSVLQYMLYSFSLVLLVKLSMFYLLKRYRKHLGGNYRTTIIIGDTFQARKLAGFFEKATEYGYQCKKTIAVSTTEKFKLKPVFEYILAENIDEIYCSISQLSNKQLNKLIDFADNNLKTLKFIPDNKDVYSRKMKLDYYGYQPILSLREIPLNDPFNKFIKRAFDLALSTFVIVFILSWLTPILAIFIKLESKGPVFFRQKRNGLDYQEFFCYKYRSMQDNPEANLIQATKNDTRVTKVGKILRKTSMDELPQFINVFLGNMSVVGPRPHMVSHTHMYANRIDKFMVRHFIKPGITGLAQTSGYRGEVETDHDIISRVRYDIFYLENWSLLLDIKIIFQTVYNAVRGEEKAY